MDARVQGLLTELAGKSEAEELEAGRDCASSVCSDFFEIEKAGFREVTRDGPRRDADMKRVDAEAEADFQAQWQWLYQGDQIFRSRFSQISETTMSAEASVMAAVALGDYTDALAQSLARSEPGGEFTTTESAERALRAELTRRHPAAQPAQIDQLMSYAREGEAEAKRFARTVETANFDQAAEPQARHAALMKIYGQVRQEVEAAKKQNPEALQDITGTYNLDHPIFEKLKSAQSSDPVRDEMALRRLREVSKYATAFIRQSGPGAPVRDVPPLKDLLDQKKFSESALPSTPPSSFVRSFEKCRLTLQRNLGDAPLEKQIAESRRAVERARQTTIQNNRARYRPSDSRILNAEIRQMPIVMPPSASELASKMIDALKLTAETARYDLATYARHSQPADYTIAEAYRFDLTDPKLLVETFSSCDYLESTFEGLFEQQSETDFREVRISAISAYDPKLAYKVGLHEFGHVSDPLHVLEDLSSPPLLPLGGHGETKRLKIDKCLAGMHGPGKPASIKTHFEDYADLNSASESVVKNCNVLSGNLRKDQRDYSIRGHSPALFRVLHMDFLKNGRLNRYCDSFVRKYKSWKFRDCRKE